MIKTVLVTTVVLNTVMSCTYKDESIENIIGPTIVSYRNQQ